MKTLVIGDIHGRSTWVDIVKEESDNIGKVVFLGDYFDSFNISADNQINNFIDIIKFKENTKLEVILLIGNHDHHYLDVGEHYTGYQPVHDLTIRELIKQNIHNLCIVHRHDDILLSHAGISTNWLNNTLPGWTLDNFVDDINELYKYRPRKFNFVDSRSPTGDSVNSGPLWIREKSLKKSNYYELLDDEFIQIYGHTYQHETDLKSLTVGKKRGKYYCIDGLEYGYYLVFDDNDIEIKKLVTK